MSTAAAGKPRPAHVQGLDEECLAGGLQKGAIARNPLSQVGWVRLGGVGVRASRRASRQSCKQAGKQAGSQSVSQSGRQAGRQAGQQVCMYAGRQEGGHASRQTGLQTDRRAGRRVAILRPPLPHVADLLRKSAVVRGVFSDLDLSFLRTGTDA